jgi:hypothetical protein
MKKERILNIPNESDTAVPEKTPENIYKAVYNCFSDRLDTCEECPLFQKELNKVNLSLCDEWMTQEIHERVQEELGDVPRYKSKEREEYAKKAAQIGLKVHFDGLYLDFRKVKELTNEEEISGKKKRPAPVGCKADYAQQEASSEDT